MESGDVGGQIPDIVGTQTAFHFVLHIGSRGFGLSFLQRFGDIGRGKYPQLAGSSHGALLTASSVASFAAFRVKGLARVDGSILCAQRESGQCERNQHDNAGDDAANRVANGEHHD